MKGKPKGKPKIYRATVRVLGKNYTTTGKSVSEAIGKLEPGIARGVSILTIEIGGKKKEKILGGAQTRSLFGVKGLFKEILLKQVSARFGDL